MPIITPGKPENYSVLIQDCDPGQNAYRNPQPLVATPCNTHQQKRESCPEQLIEGVHREQMRESKQNRSHQRSQRAKKHRPAPASQLARQQTSQNNRPNSGQRRQQPQRPKRSTYGVLQKPRDPSDQWRLINIPPRWMLSAGQVVKLIAKVSIVRTSKKIENESRESNTEDDCCTRCKKRLTLGGCHNGLCVCAHGF